MNRRKQMRVLLGLHYPKIILKISHKIASLTSLMDLQHILFC